MRNSVLNVDRWILLPFLLFLVVALAAYYYLNKGTIDQDEHQHYLERISHLIEHNASFSAELLTLNQRRERSLSQMVNDTNELYDDLQLLYRFPYWLSEAQQNELLQLLHQLQRRLDQRVDMGERFTRARSAYLNSLIQLPALRKRTELMLMDGSLEGTEYSEQFILPLLGLIDAVEQFQLFPTENRVLIEKITQLQQETARYRHDKHLAKVGNALVHLRIIVLYTTQAEDWLRRAVDSQREMRLDRYRERYNSFYSDAQERSATRGHWIELFAALLFIGILITLERLYHARGVLRSWNMNLQQQVEQRTVELEAARQEADRVVEYAADPLLVLDTEQRVVRYNQAAAQLIGGEEKSLLGRPVDSLFHALSTQAGEEQWLLSADQRQIPVLLSTSKLVGEEKKILGEVWSLRDITQVKQLYADIQSYQQAIDRLLLLTVTDTDGRIVHANSIFLERNGYSKEEVIGQTHRMFSSGYHPKRFWSQFWQTISAGEIWHGEICNRTKSGEKVWNDSSIAPMFNVEGELTGYLAVRVDITEQMELREERERLAYEGGIEEISSSILHNIGNTITGAEHQAAAVKERIDGLGRVVQYLQRLGQQSPLPDGESARLQRLSEVLGEFIEYGQETLLQQESTFSHIEGIIAAQRQVVQGGNWVSRFELAESVHEVVRLMENILQKFDTALHLNLQEAPTAVLLPKSPFQQMLANLLKNGCESIGEQMERSGEQYGGEITLTVTTAGQQFVVEIQDNGVGIAEENLEEIFSRGITTKESGTGQGLHSIALFVQRVGGTIEAKSEGTGTGAQFTIVLPIEGEELETAD